MNTYTCNKYKSFGTTQLEALQMEIDSSHAQILALEEDLDEARDTIRRLIEGECVEWEVQT